MLSTVPLGRVLPAFRDWERPWPPGPPVRDPAHCAACGRLARVFSKPWHELTARDLRGLRALPEYLTTAAYLHYLPAYLAAALGCLYWGHDHFEAIVATLRPRWSAVERYQEFHVRRAAKLDPEERHLVIAAIELVATRREWKLDCEERDAIAGLGGKPAGRLHATSFDAGPTLRTWHWVGELQDKIAAAFPTAPVPTDEFLSNRRDRDLTDERRAYFAFGGVPWDRVSAAQAWSGDGVLFVTRPTALPSCVPALMHYSLEPSPTGSELSATIVFHLSNLAVKRQSEVYAAERWNAFTPGQRRVIGEVLRAHATTDREFLAPDESGYFLEQVTKLERAAAIWIDRADESV